MRSQVARPQGQIVGRPSIFGVMATATLLSGQAAGASAHHAGAATRAHDAIHDTSVDASAEAAEARRALQESMDLRDQGHVDQAHVQGHVDQARVDQVHILSV